MNSSFRRAGAAACAAVFVCGALTGCGDAGSKAPDGTKTLVTVNGEAVSYGAVNFAVKAEQAQMYNIYSYYGMDTSNLFSQVYDTTTNLTYGEYIKGAKLDDIEKAVVIRQHAEELGVSLTDEEKAEIKDVAQAIVDAQSEEAKTMLAVTSSDLENLLELETYRAKTRDAIVEGQYDAEVNNEDAQQTSITYIRVGIEDPEEVTSGVESAASAVDVESVVEVADAESVINAAESEAEVESAAEAVVVEPVSGAESVSEEVAEPETKEALAAKAKAQQIIDAAEAAGADADLEAVVDAIDENLYVVSGKFTTNDLTDTVCDANVVEAASGLADGQFAAHPVLNADANAYYVVRVDKVFDEELTEDKKSEIIVERKQEKYEEIVLEWVESAEIKVDEKVWALVKVNDLQPVAAEYAQDDVTDSIVEAVEDALAGTESSVESAVESAAPAVIVESVVEPADAVAAVESAVESAAESALESVVEAAAESVVESAAE